MSWVFVVVQNCLQMSVFILAGHRGCSLVFAWVGVKLVSTTAVSNSSPAWAECCGRRVSNLAVGRPYNRYDIPASDLRVNAGVRRLQPSHKWLPRGFDSL